MVQQVILDTNILVASGFNSHSHAAQIIEWIRAGTLVLVWHQKTRAECQRVIKQIPPLTWTAFERLFAPENQVRTSLAVGDFQFIPDPDDRKFAALAVITGVPLISNDRHLLECREWLKIRVMRSNEFIGGGFEDE